MKRRLRISRGGPTSIWRRFRMGRIVPAPDDPFAAAEGALAEEFGNINVERLRQTVREEESAAATRRQP